MKWLRLLASLCVAPLLYGLLCLPLLGWWLSLFPHKVNDLGGTFYLPLVVSVEALQAVDSLAWFANERYRPFLEKCLRNHAAVGGFFLVLLCLSLALFGGGYLKSAFFPRVNSDFIVGRGCSAIIRVSH